MLFVSIWFTLVLFRCFANNWSYLKIFWSNNMELRRNKEKYFTILGKEQNSRQVNEWVHFHTRVLHQRIEKTSQNRRGQRAWALDTRALLARQTYAWEPVGNNGRGKNYHSAVALRTDLRVGDSSKQRPWQFASHGHCTFGNSSNRR